MSEYSESQDSLGFDTNLNVSPRSDDDSQPISDITASSMPGLYPIARSDTGSSISSVASADSAVSVASAVSYASSRSFESIASRLSNSPARMTVGRGRRSFGFSDILSNITTFASDVTRVVGRSAESVCTSFSRQFTVNTTRTAQYLAVTGAAIFEEAVKNILGSGPETTDEVISSFDGLVNANGASILSCVEQGENRILEIIILSTKTALQEMAKASKEKISTLQGQEEIRLLNEIEQLRRTFQQRVNEATNPEQVNTLFQEFQEHLRNILVQVSSTRDLSQSGIFPPRQPGGRKTKKNRSCKNLHKCNTVHYCNVCHQPHKCEGHKSNKCHYHPKHGYHHCTMKHYCSSCGKMHKCNAPHKNEIVEGGRRTRKSRKSIKNKSCKRLHKCDTTHDCSVCHKKHKCHDHKMGKCHTHAGPGSHICKAKHKCKTCHKEHVCNCSHK